MALKVFWLKCGPRHGNFGDHLTPMLLDYFNVKYEWSPADNADLTGIGSLCEKIPRYYSGAVWTSGNLYSSQRNEFYSARVLALRGLLTCKRTNCSGRDNMALGDGGLLCHLLAPTVRKKQHKLGMIPHYVDANDSAIQGFAASNSDTLLIDICDEPQNVIQNAARCEYILSSSLHGLILADTLGIPNRWMEADGKILGEGFKFRDYYSVYNINCPTPVQMRAAEPLDNVLSYFEDYRRPGLDIVTSSVLEKLSEVLQLDSIHPPKNRGALLRQHADEKTISHHVHKNNFNNGKPLNDGRDSETALRSTPMVTGTRKRIFVVGTGRSGTCWMGELLDAHPQICGHVEPKPVFDLVTKAALDARQEEFLLDEIFAEYDRLFDDAAPFHFADKTHPLLWLAEMVAARYESSYFIAMLRDVEPTVASMLRHRGVRRWCEQWHTHPIPNRFLGVTTANLDWYRDASIVERCAARWWAHSEEIRRLKEILRGRLLTVRYEELVTNTTATLANVCRFLSLDHAFSTANGKTESLSKWKTQLNGTEVASIHGALARLNNSAGESVAQIARHVM